MKGNKSIMKHLLTLLTLCLISIGALGQQRFTTSELEKLMYLNISKAHDYFIGKGLFYLGGDTSSLFNESKVIKFGTRTPLKIIIMISYYKNETLPNLVSYTCNEDDLDAKKSYYISKGFKLFNSFTNNNITKYFFDKKGSYFYLAFGSSYDMSTRISANSVQLMTKSKDYVE
jgi:hypothetical protein